MLIPHLFRYLTYTKPKLVKYTPANEGTLEEINRTIEYLDILTNELKYNNENRVLKDRLKSILDDFMVSSALTC
jgi:hypothetical protein